MSQLRYFVRFQLNRAQNQSEEVLLVHPTEAREQVVPPINESELDSPANKKPRGIWNSRQGLTWKGHEVKHGVPIGVWKLSEEPIDERKHVLYGFVDPKSVLHARKYPERKDGTRYQGNFPSGTGSWAAKSDTWLLDPHLKSLSRIELTEYVRIRVGTWKPDELPTERDALDARAVAHAKVAAVTAQRQEKTKGKENSARKAKSSKSRTSSQGNLDNSTPKRSCGELSPSHPSLVNSTMKASQQGFTPPSSAPMRASIPTNNGTPLAKRDSREPHLAFPLRKSQRLGTSNKAKSDAIAQMLKLERKQAKERATANSSADVEPAEAMRQNAKEQEALEAQKEPGQNADALPTTEAGIHNNITAATPRCEPSKELLSANDDLRQNSNTPFSDAITNNSSEPDKHSSQVKFYLLDREAQRAKMERWCQRKPTSQYHKLDREGQKRHVEKHIDQLILRQTGSPKAHGPKNQSGTEGLSYASPAQPGVVSAPSSLADVMDVMSTSKTVVQSPKSMSNMQNTTAAAEATADVLRAPAPSAPKYPSILEEPARVLPSELQKGGPIVEAPNINTFATQIPAPGATQSLGEVQTQFWTTPVQTANSYFTQPAGFNASPQAAMGKQTVQSEQHAGTQRQTQVGQKAYSTRQAAKENQTLQSEQYARAQQQPQIGQHAYSNPQDFWNLSERSPGLQSAPCNTAARQFIAPYPTPSSLNGSDPDIKASLCQPTKPQRPDLNSIPSSAKLLPRLTSHPPAPEIKEGDDGIKYRIRPGSKFTRLLVSLNRDVVQIDNADHVKQHVLPMQDSLPSLQQAPDVVSDVDGVEYKMALNGLFEGYLVELGARLSLSIGIWTT
ncbi:hypothetical protein ACLOAV_009930 [Pseudogymnoascus australis]